MSQIPTFRMPEATPLAADLDAAARAFLPAATEIAAIAGHPELAKVSAPSGLWRVRRWPEGTPQGDVAFSRAVMNRAREAGISFVPEPLAPPDAPDDAALRLGDRLYSAQRWLPGAPAANAETAWPEPDDRIDLPVVLPGAAFSVSIAALAQLHEATASLATIADIPAAPLRLLPGAVRQAQGRHLAALRPRARHEPSIQRWLATGERLLAAAEPLVLAATEERETPASILHLGLWPAHVLLDDGRLSGLLGWERVAAGNPLLDIAQATLRLQGWSEASVEVALGAYRDARELAPEERRLLPAVAALDAVATTGRLLEQTYSQDDPARPPSALRNGIEMMLRSMTALDRELNAPSAKSRRQWIRRGPPPGRPQGGRRRDRGR